MENRVLAMARIPRNDIEAVVDFVRRYNPTPGEWAMLIRLQDDTDEDFQETIERRAGRS